MALIEFKDLPDTSTPINAENLNNNFNYLKNKYWCGTSRITSFGTISDVVPFNVFKTNTNQITIQNGVITVGANIKSVKVSYNVRYDWDTETDIGYYQMLNGNNEDLFVTQSAHIASGTQGIPNYSNFVIDTSIYKTIQLKVWSSHETNEAKADAYIYIEVLEEE